MKNVFVFCASAPKARLNFPRTVASEVSEDVVLSSFPVEKHKELLSWQSQAGGFYVWGIKPSQRVLSILSKLKTGECVLGFFDFRYQSIANLMGRAKSSHLAEKLWGSLDWDEIIFMDKPKLIAIEATRIQPYLCSSYRGATRIGSERIEKVIQDFGSLESFVSKIFTS